MLKTKKVLSKDQTFFLSKGGGVTILTGLVWRHLASVLPTTVSAEILTNGPQRGSVLRGATYKKARELSRFVERLAA